MTQETILPYDEVAKAITPYEDAINVSEVLGERIVIESYESVPYDDTDNYYVQIVRKDDSKTVLKITSKVLKQKLALAVEKRMLPFSTVIKEKQSSKNKAFRYQDFT